MNLRTVHSGKVKSKAVRRARTRAPTAAAGGWEQPVPPHTASGTLRAQSAPPRPAHPRLARLLSGPAPRVAPPPRPGKGTQVCGPWELFGGHLPGKGAAERCRARPGQASRVRHPVHSVPPPDAAVRSRPVPTPSCRAAPQRSQDLRLLPKESAAFQRWAAQSVSHRAPEGTWQVLYTHKLVLYSRHHRGHGHTVGAPLSHTSEAEK